MNIMRTAMLLALMTALFMGVGYLIGGGGGMMIAFFVALAMNAFSYWNSDKMVLRMHNAREVDERMADELHRHPRLAIEGGLERKNHEHEVRNAPHDVPTEESTGLSLLVRQHFFFLFYINIFRPGPKILVCNQNHMSAWL